MLTENTPLLPGARDGSPQSPEAYPTYKSVLRPLLSLSFPVTTTAVFVYLLPMTRFEHSFLHVSLSLSG
jgi:hypothetical protein